MLPTIVVIRAKDEGLARGQGVVEVPILKPIPNDEAVRQVKGIVHEEVGCGCLHEHNSREVHL